METERLIIDQIKETDKEDYFINISHDKKVLETFICRYADSLEEFDFSSYPGRQDLFAIRLKETGRLIGIILYFDEKIFLRDRLWNRFRVLESGVRNGGGLAVSGISVSKERDAKGICIFLYRE